MTRLNQYKINQLVEYLIYDKPVVVLWIINVQLCEITFGSDELSNTQRRLLTEISQDSERDKRLHS